MADWRQIQARIRKAKTSTDPPSQLAELYERTRDAMVAFELAQWHERAGDHGEAARWYTSAAQRFRRAQWRTKAEEALTRLGAPIPAPLADSAADTKPAESAQAEEAASLIDGPPVAPTAEATSEVPIEQAGEQADEAGEQADEAEEQPTLSTSSVAPVGAQPRKKRRRGRRGGRGRQRGKGVQAGAGEASGPVARGPAQSSVPASSSLPAQVPAPSFISATPISATPRALPARPEPETASPPAAERNHQAAPAPSWQARESRTTRAGEPALASRMSQLESQLRRLLACPQASLDDADQAPAGPGVLVLSDSDQVTHYYIEACQTLRIGIGNLMRGGRGSEAVHLKERLAENLGIADSRVPKYLKDHCAVRWLQLDEGARELAHFAIAVLRPVVNE